MVNLSLSHLFSDNLESERHKKLNKLKHLIYYYKKY